MARTLTTGTAIQPSSVFIRVHPLQKNASLRQDAAEDGTSRSNTDFHANAPLHARDAGDGAGLVLADALRHLAEEEMDDAVDHREAR